MTADSPAFSINDLYALLDEFQATSFPKHADLSLKQATIPFFLETVRLACEKSSLEAVGHLVPEAVRALDAHRAKALPLGGHAHRPEDWLQSIKESAWSLMQLLQAEPQPADALAAALAPEVDPNRAAELPMAPRQHLGITPPETHAEPPATWGTGVEFIDPGALCDHPAWRQYLGFSHTEDEEQLVEFVREHRTLHPFIVTGKGCASPPDTILDGHRGRRAAMDARIPLVPVIRRTDLTAEAEETLILKSGLASKHVRRLVPSKVFALEERLYALYSRGPGHRTDLGTCVDSNAGSSRRPDTASRVARETGESRNAVANRRKVFASPVSTKRLQEAVDVGTLSLSAAADLVRQVESGDAVSDALRAPNSTPAQVERAREELDAQLRTKLGLPESRPKKGPSKRTRPNAYELPLDGTPTRQWTGRWRVTRRVVGVTATHVVIEETKEPAKPNATLPASEPSRPIASGAAEDDVRSERSRSLQ